MNYRLERRKKLPNNEAGELARDYVKALLKEDTPWARDVAMEIRRRLRDGPSYLSWLQIESDFDYREPDLFVEDSLSLTNNVEQCIHGTKDRKSIENEDLVNLFFHYLKRRRPEPATVVLDQLDEVTDRDALCILREIRYRLCCVGKDGSMEKIWSLYMEGVADESGLIAQLLICIDPKFVAVDTTTLDDLDSVPLLGD